MELLAVYGTLLSGLPPRSGRPDLTSLLRLVGPCRIPGQLCDCGPYPGLLDRPGIVVGECWQIIAAETLAVLDRWEDYQPNDEARSEYLRCQLRLIDPPITAWVYRYNRQPKTIIPSGDWRQYIANR
jgi:gamma-glutamylcyclotransferase (GGCT)/AIG2-like uncharacterized protein YtfP